MLYTTAMRQSKLLIAGIAIDGALLVVLCLCVILGVSVIALDSTPTPPVDATATEEPSATETVHLTQTPRFTSTPTTTFTPSPTLTDIPTPTLEIGKPPKPPYIFPTPIRIPGSYFPTPARTPIR